jgi:hypothetical protein
MPPLSHLVLTVTAATTAATTTAATTTTATTTSITTTTVTAAAALLLLNCCYNHCYCTTINIRLKKRCAKIERRSKLVVPRLRPASRQICAWQLQQKQLARVPSTARRRLMKHTELLWLKSDRESEMQQLQQHWQLSSGGPLW